MHVPGKSNVADFLSRIPGTESLQPEFSCNMLFTLGIKHLCDIPAVTNFSSF